MWHTLLICGLTVIGILLVLIAWLFISESLAKKSTRTYDRLSRESGWKRTTKRACERQLPTHIYFDITLPIASDADRLFIYCGDADERIRQTLTTAHEQLQAAASTINRKKRVLEFLIVNPMHPDSSDDETPADSDSLFRQHSTTPMPEGPYLLHYVEELTRLSFLKADIEGTTPCIVYSLFPLHSEEVLHRPASDYLDEQLGPCPPVTDVAGELTKRFCEDIADYINLIENSPSSTLFSIKSDEDHIKEWVEQQDAALRALRAINAPTDIIERVAKLAFPAARKQLIISEELEVMVPLFTPQHCNGMFVESQADRIAMTQYDHSSGYIKIKMSPICRALYFLYLRHPEGISFKELANHTDELYELYAFVSRREDADAMRHSIASLTDSTNNSVNEKCSRIRFAFLNAWPGELLGGLCIKGKAGQPRNVEIDRHLIEDRSGMILPHKRD